jgi:Rnl2 family RNA ligase
MIKYPSLINHYRKKELDKFDINEDETFVISEKIHGSNVSIRFNSDGSVDWYSRNNKITGANFYNAETIFEYFKNEHTKILSYAIKHNIDVILFGELYGGNVQSGVYYGNEKNLAFFDLAVVENDVVEFRSPEVTFSFFNFFDVPVVPILKTGSITECMDYDIEFNSKLTPKGYDKENLCEGVVIRPYFRNITSNQGKHFIIKKKNEKFKEKQKKSKPKVELSDDVKYWVDVFSQYIHPERLQSVYSKYGKIESYDDIGKYIKLVLEDAKETFLAEEETFNESDFEKKDLKVIYKQGSVIRDLLMKDLEN